MYSAEINVTCDTELEVRNIEGVESRFESYSAGLKCSLLFLNVWNPVYLARATMF